MTRRLGVVDDNGKTTTADLGLRRDQIHEARQTKDAAGCRDIHVAPHACSLCQPIYDMLPGIQAGGFLAQ